MNEPPQLLNQPYEMSKARGTVVDTEGVHELEITHWTLGYSPWIVLVVESVEDGRPNFAVMWGGMESTEAQEAIRALAASLPPVEVEQSQESPDGA